MIVLIEKTSGGKWYLKIYELKMSGFLNTFLIQQSGSQLPQNLTADIDVLY